MTVLRLLLTGLGMLVLALLLVMSFSSWTDPSVFAVRSWVLGVLTVVGCGLIVAAALVSALSTERTTPAAEPAVDHYA
jgi:ABC-type transport system involved in multi-copper enzyme maturation permease subunit